MTNYEKIKAMSVEEMHKFFLEYAVKVLREMKGVSRLEARFRVYFNQQSIRKLLESEVE